MGCCAGVLQPMASRHTAPDHTRTHARMHANGRHDASSKQARRHEHKQAQAPSSSTRRRPGCPSELRRPHNIPEAPPPTVQLLHRFDAAGVRRRLCP
jgi:hypothetical protein